MSIATLLVSVACDMLANIVANSAIQSLMDIYTYVFRTVTVQFITRVIGITDVAAGRIYFSAKKCNPYINDADLATNSRHLADGKPQDL